MTHRPHLGIDLRIGDPPRAERTGLGRFSFEVVRALVPIAGDWRLSLYSNRPPSLFGGPADAVRVTGWPTATSAGRVAWVHAGSWLDTRADRPDVWLSPAYVLPAWWRGPAVVAIHDLSFIEMPERYRGRLNAWHARTQTVRAARQATRVVCGSAPTARRLERELGVDGERISVVPYGVGEPFRAERGAAAPERPFALFVGTFEARKGLDVVLAALDAVNRGGVRLELVLAGKPGWGTETILRELATRPWARIVDDPDDVTLAGLYRTATALVHPSRREGFGLPVAEAMASGCPVVASDLPEIRAWAGDDAAAWTPVGDAAAVARELDALLASAGRADALRDAGARAAAALSWSRTATAVLGEARDALDGA